MKKKLAFLLCLVMVFSMLTACGGSQSEDTGSQDSGSAAQTEDVLYHVYHSSPYVTLDPSTEYSNGILVLQNVYETLTYYNSETGELEPKLATEWSSNEDGTVWTFKLREGVKWVDKDGNEVVEDAKGHRTAEYILKRKMMLHFHGIRLHEV